MGIIIVFILHLRTQTHRGLNLVSHFQIQCPSTSILSRLYKNEGVKILKNVAALSVGFVFYDVGLSFLLYFLKWHFTRVYLDIGPF